MADWIGFVAFVAGIAAVFAGLGWAAWTSFPPGRRMFATATVIQLTAVWFVLVVWLAVR